MGGIGRLDGEPIHREDAAGRLDNLEELISPSSFNSVRELVGHAALATSRDGEGAAPAVRLMSMHRAKGLEFDHVFLPAFEKGIIPFAYGDPDEERRLAYVALTRGPSAALRSRGLEYRRSPGEPSPFIADIPAHAKSSADRARHPSLSRDKAAALRALSHRTRSF